MRVSAHGLVRVGCGKPRTTNHRNTNGLHRRGPRRGLELSRGPRLPHLGFISRDIGSSSASLPGCLASSPRPLPRSCSSLRHASSSAAHGQPSSLVRLVAHLTSDNTYTGQQSPRPTFAHSFRWSWSCQGILSTFWRTRAIQLVFSSRFSA